MSTDPEVIRAESYREVGEIVERDAGLIVERWRRRAVEEQPNAVHAHLATLLDHLPVFLLALGRSLAEADDDTAEHRGPAVAHGEQRWEAGWSLPEVVRDYQILRLVLVDYLEETLDRPLRSREVMAVGLALDEAITASVGMYVAHREESVRAAEREKTDRERTAKEALEAADRRKDEFLATLAHELRNPLAPILHAAEAPVEFQEMARLLAGVPTAEAGKPPPGAPS